MSVVLLILLLLLVAVNGFFVAAEFAIVRLLWERSTDS